MYGIRGERELTELTLDHLAGYKDSKPVRIGNDAYHQRQNDSFGYLMDLIYQYYCLMPGTLDEVEYMWEMVKCIALTVCENWRKPDKGIWEIRGEAQQFVSSKVMCWVALDRVAEQTWLWRAVGCRSCVGQGGSLHIRVERGTAKLLPML